jgi:hypothetical protein
VACGQGRFENLFKVKALECLCTPERCERTGLIGKTGKPLHLTVVGGGGQLLLAGASPERVSFWSWPGIWSGSWGCQERCCYPISAWTKLYWMTVHLMR